MAGDALDPHGSPAITTLAILGAIAWSLQLIPQIYLNYTRHHTQGLHSSMMILWSLAGLPLAVHNILSGQHVALQVQAEVLTGLSLGTWGQCMYYGEKWSLRKCVVVTSSLMIIFGTIQAAFILGFKYGPIPLHVKENFILSTAILAAILLSLGVLRHYWDIYQERTVRGLSWGFVGLDAAGDLFSLLAIVLRNPVDKVAVGIYASELTLWVGIMFAGLVYNLPKALKRRFGSTTTATTPRAADETIVHGGTEPEPEPDFGAEEVEVDLEEEQMDRMSVFSSIRAERRILPRFRLRNRTRTRTVAS